MLSTNYKLMHSAFVYRTNKVPPRGDDEVLPGVLRSIPVGRYLENLRCKVPWRHLNQIRLHWLLWTQGDQWLEPKLPLGV